MLKRKTIIILGGWAQSGKSSTIKIFQNLNVPTLSTSVTLDRVLDKIAPEFSYFVPSQELVERNPLYKLQRRNVKIKLAEEILRPKLGKDVLVNQVINELKEIENNLVVIESIGGEEYEFLISKLSKLSEKPRIFNVNLRRKSEEPGIDIRKLLPNAIEIQNNGNLEEMVWKIDKLVEILSLDFFEEFRSEGDLKWLEQKINIWEKP